MQRYELLSVLGHGGFGITYHGRDTQLGREVAIKEYLPTSLALREGGTTVVPRSTELAENFIWGRERFLEEARTLVTLEKAPAIVRVYDFVEAHGTAYMIMALVRGETLEQRLKREKQLPPQIVERMLGRLLDGLEAVHKAGFLHRDIKPANIMFDSDGDPILIDFGAARASLAGRTTALSFLVYTPRYSAFEQQDPAGRLGPPADIYCLAASMYHAISGSPPPAAISRALDDTYQPLVELRPAGFSRALLLGVDAGLAVRARDRPQSIAAWRHVLTAATTFDEATILDSRSPPRKAPTSVTPEVEPPGQPSVPPLPPVGPAAPQRRTGLWIAIAAIVLVLLGGSGYFAFAPRGPDPAEVKAKVEAEEAAKRQKQVEEEAAKQRAEARQKAEAEARQRAEAEARKDCPQCPEMVSIPPGTFLMGAAPDEEESDNMSPANRGQATPQRTVTISRPFSLGKYEVTRGEYAAFVAATGHADSPRCWGRRSGGKVEEEQGLNWRKPGFDQTASHPVVCVTWNDAQAYVEWLSKETGKRYRLPSEAEWEYAARAGTTTTRYWGNNAAAACQFANVGDETAAQKFNWKDGREIWFRCNDNHAFTAPVGTFPVNGFGLHDMLGNVWEWTADCWTNSYKGAASTQEANLGGNCDYHVMRGGGWATEPSGILAAYRGGTDNSRGDKGIGFRVARTD